MTQDIGTSIVHMKMANVPSAVRTALERDPFVVVEVRSPENNKPFAYVLSTRLWKALLGSRAEFLDWLTQGGPEGEIRELKLELAKALRANIVLLQQIANMRGEETRLEDPDNYEVVLEGAARHSILAEGLEPGGDVLFVQAGTEEGE